MKRFVLTIALVATLLVPTMGMARSVEDACGEAAKYNWYCVPCNTSCLFAMMADICGPGPDGMW